MMLDQVKNLSHQRRLFGIHQACDPGPPRLWRNNSIPWSSYACCSKKNCWPAKTAPPRRSPPRRAFVSAPIWRIRLNLP